MAQCGKQVLITTETDPKQTVKLLIKNQLPIAQRQPHCNHSQ